MTSYIHYDCCYGYGYEDDHDCCAMIAMATIAVITWFTLILVGATYAVSTHAHSTEATVKYGNSEPPGSNTSLDYRRESRSYVSQHVERRCMRGENF